MGTVNTYIKLVTGSVKNSIVNRWSFAFNLLGSVVSDVPAFLALVLIMTRFSSINGWTLGQMVFIYTLSHLSYGLRNLFFGQMRNMVRLVRDGDFDRILLRPMNSLLYISGDKFTIGGCSHIILSTILFIIFINDFGVKWSFTNAFMFILAVLSSALVQSAITIFIAGASFFIIDTKGLENVYSGLREFIWYPITIFDKVIQFLLFTIIPLAFASYVPAGIFLDNPDYLILPGWVWKLSLLVGFILFYFSYLFWKFSIKHYVSTGN